MNRTEKVNELIGKLGSAAQNMKSKKNSLADQISESKQQIQDLHRRLDAALVGTDGTEGMLLDEIRTAEETLQRLADLHDRLCAANVKHVVTSDDLIGAFREATTAIREEVNAAVARATEAKRAYEDSLAEIERLCEQQRSFNGRVNHAAQLHLGKVIDGQLPKLTPPREPYINFAHYEARGN